MSCNFFFQRFPVENAVMSGNSGYQVHPADPAVPDQLKKLMKVNVFQRFQLFSVLCVLQKKEYFFNIPLFLDNLQFTVVTCNKFNKFLAFAPILPRVKGRGSVAEWPSGQGAGLEIWRSRVQVPLWPLAGFVPRSPWLNSSAALVYSQLVCLLPVGILNLLSLFQSVN